jgi:hypothetical protein
MLHQLMLAALQPAGGRTIYSARHQRHFRRHRQRYRGDYLRSNYWDEGPQPIWLGHPRTDLQHLHTDRGDCDPVQEVGPRV